MDRISTGFFDKNGKEVFDGDKCSIMSRGLDFEGIARAGRSLENSFDWTNDFSRDYDYMFYSPDITTLEVMGCKIGQRN